MLFLSKDISKLHIVTYKQNVEPDFLIIYSQSNLSLLFHSLDLAFSKKENVLALCGQASF